jgi:hypothetical protein
VTSKSGSPPVFIKNYAPSEWQEFAFADGDWYYATPAGRWLRVKVAGDLIDDAFKKKFQKQTLQSRSYFQSFFAEEFSHVFHMPENQSKTLKPYALIKPEDLLEKMFLSSVVDQSPSKADAGDLIGEHGPCSLFTWASFCRNEFTPSPALTSEIFEKNLLLYRRSFYFSSLLVLGGVLLGYGQKQLLQDLYLVGYLLDIGLIQEQESYRMMQACEFERRFPGQGIDWLKRQGVSEDEITKYKNHPHLSKTFTEERNKENFHFPGVMSILDKHHELSQAEGFPDHINHSGLSDLDCLLIWIDATLPFDNEDLEQFTSFTLKQWFQRSLQQKLAEKRPLLKIVDKIKCLSLEITSFSLPRSKEVA